MKATEANFLEFLGSPKQLAIPIYQRTYSWTRSQCRQLWNDIVRVAEHEEIPAHFIGSIVYITEGIYQATSIPRLLVIDGQQRLTSLSLLIIALTNELKTSNEKRYKQLRNYYIVNANEEDELHYKLILTRGDKETYIHVVDGRDISKHMSPRLQDNYQFFVNMVRNTDVDLELLVKGISKLVIVDVSLDRNYDNPQLIFESLNSTGLDLSQADLIRNYILMGLERQQQEYLYNQYWYPMEQNFAYVDYSTLFDRFMRDYLTIKSPAGQIPAIRNIYADFKIFSMGKDVEELVADIYHYSKYFTKLAYPERNDDKVIAAILQDINTLKVDVAYPLLIEVYDDYERHGLLTRDEFIQILQLVESYVLRRAIVGIPTNSMNKTFATFKRSIVKEEYLSSVKYALMQLDSYRRFPLNDEFWQAFAIKDIYNLRQRRNYILSRLENFNRKEFVNVEEYTIEHIMPQNARLSAQWQEILGEHWKDIQAKYLHTIGNLTLTGYNPELSDHPFQYKRDVEGGFADSPLRLNRDIAKLDDWNEKEICNRAERLADLALKVWREPELSQEVVEFFDSLQHEDDEEQYSLEQFEHLTGDMKRLFDVLRTRTLNLDSSVRMEVKKLYIAFKTTTNFVDVVPQKRRLRLSLNMAFDEIDDPQQLCNDVSALGRWGNGDVEIGLSSIDELEYIMFLIRQSFAKHTELEVL